MSKPYQEREVRKKIHGVKAVKDSALYVKIVEWSDEDQCFVWSNVRALLVRAVMEMIETQVVMCELCDKIVRWNAWPSLH